MKYKCPKCEFETDDRYKIAGHVSSHTKKRKIECDKCGKMVSSLAFNRHYKVCKGKVEQKTKIKYSERNGKVICPICDKEFSKFGIANHIRSKHERKNNYSPGGWNKGLTKETDERVKKFGETYSRNIKLGKIKPSMKGKKHTKRTKEKIGEAIKGKTGGYREGGGRSKGEYYKDFYFDSQFEIEVAKDLDKEKIKWRRNTKRFYFEWNGKKTYYIPDFYFEDHDLYLETKGYWYSKEKFDKTIYCVKKYNLNWCLIMQTDYFKYKNKFNDLFLTRYKFATPVFKNK